MKTLFLAIMLIVLASPVFAQSTLYSNSTTGDVGIGTTSPQSLLHVYGGEVQVGSSSAVCSATNAGALRYSGGSAYVCDSSRWDVLGGSSGGTLPTLASGDIWVGNALNVATAQAMSGDCTMSNTGAITCTKTNGTSFGTLATTSSVNLSTQATGTLQAAQSPALTGDVTTTAGSLSTTVAKVQGTTVSGTTGTGNVVFSASPTLTGTVTGAASNWSGKVGIGTVTPAYALDVVNSSGDVVAHFSGTSVTGADVIIDDAMGGEYAGLKLWDGGIQKWELAKAMSSNNLYIYDNPGNQFFLTAVSGGSLTLGPAQSFNITQSGTVGVGNSSPSYTLQVSGSVAGTSAYVNTSDARYKKNIEPLQLGLQEITQLQPVTFEWKDEPKDNGMKGQQIGFVAQDVEKILPSVVVTEDNKEKTKGMKYSEIIPVLTKAIQEQQQQIEKDNVNIDALQAKLTADEEIIVAMKTKLGM